MLARARLVRLDRPRRHPRQILAETPGIVNEKTCAGAPLGVKARMARAGSSLGLE